MMEIVIDNTTYKIMQYLYGKRGIKYGKIRKNSVMIIHISSRNFAVVDMLRFGITMGSLRKTHPIFRTIVKFAYLYPEISMWKIGGRQM